MKTHYEFNKPPITAIVVDGYYMWIAFQGVSNSCTLRKVSIFDPNTIYFHQEIVAAKITRLYTKGLYLYATIDDATNIAFFLNTTNPLTTVLYTPIPVGINEVSCDLVIGDTEGYLLTPGVDSGENSKAIKINKTTGVFISTIDLNESGKIVDNAKKIDLDGNGNIWIYTGNNPVDLIKITMPASTYEVWQLT